MIKLICECGQSFERPMKYKEYDEKFPNVIWKWKLKYCDLCYKERKDNALKGLPEIMNTIAKN